MNSSKLLIAGTLTLNLAMTAALIRANADLQILLFGKELSGWGQHIATAKPSEKGLTGADAALYRSEETQDYILDVVRSNPDAVLDALKLLQARETAQLEQDQLSDVNDVGERADFVDRNKKPDIEQVLNAHVGGNPDGDVTIVEFFDYNCPHCKKASPVLEKVVSSDGNIRVIYREFPILTPGSAFAARAALASRQQDLYEEFHTAMMAEQDPLEEADVLRIAEEVGIDLELLERDIGDPSIVEHLRTSQDLAEYYEIQGTPAFAINGEIHAGAPTEARLTREISEARSK